MTADVDAQRRILAVLAIADDEPDLDELAAFLSDPDDDVRRTAVDVLVEGAPDGTEAALAAALRDVSPVVRAAAAAGLRELDDVVVVTGGVRDTLLAALADGDPVVAETVLALARKLRFGTADLFWRALGSAHVPVRLEALHGFVALNDVGGLASARHDPAREVRVALARGLGTIGSVAGVAPLLELAADPEPLVRAAALTASGELGSPDALRAAATAGAADPRWEVRIGAANALRAAPIDDVLDTYGTLVGDVHLDVRKAAVRAVGTRSADNRVHALLTNALADTDADVRSYARLAIERQR